MFDHIIGHRATVVLPAAGLVSAAGAVLITVRLLATPSSHTPTFCDVAPILGGVLIVVAAQTVAHAMYLDGLTDVTDAFGSYKPPKGTWEVLRDLNTGPMGMGSIVLIVLTTAIALAGIVAGVLAQWSGDRVQPGVVALCLPFVVFRTAAMATYWHGFSPFSSSGSGSLTAGTQSMVAVTYWRVLPLAVLGWVVGFVGVVACALSFDVTLLLTRHCVKRFDGINGDVFGVVTGIACVVYTGVLVIGS